MLSPNAAITGRASGLSGGLSAAFTVSGGAFGAGSARDAGLRVPVPQPASPATAAIIRIEALKELRISRPIIEVIRLTRSIETPTHRVEILRGIDLSIPRGQFAAIMGPSGSGKSTLLGLLAGLDNATSGQLLLDGEDITGLSEDRMAEVRGRKIGFVFQSFQLIPTLTAEENVLLPAELAGTGPGFSYKDATKRARELLTRVGLADRLDHYPVQLSGGEQQRVALARAFITRPPLLLADEPTGNLDGKTGQQVLELLLELNRREGATLVLVTHDPALAAHADRIITLRDGLIVSDELARAETLA
jgi:putative ABC transport system ATP-binding protein